MWQRIVFRQLFISFVINSFVYVFLTACCSNSVYFCVVSKKHFKYNIDFNGIKSSTQAEENRVNVVNCWSETPQINFGTKDKNIGKHAVISLKAATSDLKQGHVDAIVTAPINKDCIQSDEFNFPGHTDYLDNEIEGNALMLMLAISCFAKAPATTQLAVSRAELLPPPL